MKLLANIISYFFHPLFLPLYAIIFLMWCNPYYYTKLGSPNSNIILINVIINTILLPLIVLIGLKKSKLLDDFKMQERQQRAIPFIAVMFFFFWTFIIFIKKDFFPIGLTPVMLGAVLSIAGAYVVNVLYFKISLHTVGVGAFFAIVLFASSTSLYALSPILMLTILIGGIIGTSRLILNAHTNQEVSAGYMLGFFAQFAAFMIL